MISIEIQELFDGTLNDERTAELLHSLSVSPEKRLEFQRHLALQNAMLEDRASSAMTADEDAAIWGAISGTGSAALVTTAAGSSLGWFARGAMVLLVGLAGYFLGTNPSTNLFDRADSPAPVIAQAPAERGTERADAPVVADRTAPGAAAQQQGAAVIAEPSPRVNVISPSISANNRGGGSTSLMERSTTTSRDIARSESDIDGNTPSLSDRDARSTENGPIDLSTTSSSSTPRVEVPARETEQPVNLESSRKEISTPQQTTDTAERKSENSAHLIERQQPLSPAEVEQAMNRNDGTSDLPEENALQATAPWTDGMEIAYGENVGMLTGDLGTETPTFANRFLSVSYRFADARYGLGARFGYGGFTKFSLVERLNVRELPGSLREVDTVYTTKLAQSNMPLVEFFVGHRFRLMNNLALDLELSAGGSTSREAGSHTKAGGALSMIWFATDRLGIQAGGSYGRYWYNLKGASAGKNIDDTNVESYTGGMFEGRYGLFYHF